MLHACLKLIIAPAATNNSDPSNAIGSRESGYPPTMIQLVPHVAGIFGYGMPDQLASRNHVISAPAAAASPSDFPCRRARSPSPCSAFIVVAAAIPLGNG